MHALNTRPNGRRMKMLEIKYEREKERMNDIDNRIIIGFRNS